MPGGNFAYMVDSSGLERGKRLMSARLAAGLSMAELGRRAGVAQPSNDIKRYEKGRGMDYRRAAAIAKELGINVEWLWSGAGPRNADKTAADAPDLVKPIVVGEYVRSGRGNPMTENEETTLTAYVTACPDATAERLHLILMAHRAPLATAGPATKPQVDPPPKPPKKGGSGPRPLVEITEAMTRAGGSAGNAKRGG